MTEGEGGGLPGALATSLSAYPALVRALRPQQWLKNLLVFAPPVLAHNFLDPHILVRSGLAFLSFSILASGGYLLNDILDIEADRAHAVKRLRPFASGELPIRTGAFAIPALLLVSLGLAAFLPRDFLGILVLYFLTNTAYSLLLKRAALIDVLVLAGLYTLRIIAGGAATDTPLSFWLLAFSMFLFLSLGLVKRYAELSNLTAQGELHTPRRGYSAGDLEALAQFGSSSAYLSVLVLALYINSDSVDALYSNPQVLWLLCPLLLYLMSRIWLLARRGEVHEDPLVFILEDRRTYLLAGLGGLLLWLAA
jgi:4-hydroxybenzoate polyprenyltransferase